MASAGIIVSSHEKKLEKYLWSENWGEIILSSLQRRETNTMQTLCCDILLTLTEKIWAGTLI